MTEQPSDLFRMVYVSRNRIEGDLPAMRIEVERILEASRRNNAALGVTGALLFNAGCFAQVLEGPLAVVEALIERLQLDPRHADVVVLDVAPVAQRAFGQWSMAFAGEVPEARASLEGIGTEPAESAAATDRILGLLHEVVRREELSDAA